MSKSFWMFYVITALILLGGAAVPLWNFFIMVLAYYSDYRQAMRFDYNVTLIIPFMAVMTAIFVGFLFLPVLWRMSMLKKRIIVSVGAICIFVGLGFYSEMIAARLRTTIEVLTSRMMRSPSDIAMLTSEMSIPWVVRIHYYVFSVILILAVLNFLYSLANVLYGDGKPNKSTVVINGIATTCYALAYFLVRVMQFENISTLYLTQGSVLNAAICFILAAVAVGLYSNSFVRYKGWGKIIPSVLSAIAVLVLYAAQYAMLGGNFYTYSGNAVITIFLRLVIVAVPGVIVYFVPRYTGTNSAK